MYESNASKIKSRNYSSIAHREKSIQNMSPSRMKQNNLTSSFDNDKLVFLEKQNTVFNNEHEKKRIKQRIAEEKPSTIPHKLQKTYENVSSLHSESFFESLKRHCGNDDFVIKSYEITEPRKITNVNEFRSIFSKNGVHIYDIKEYGIDKYNASIRMNFKIRRTVDRQSKQKIDNIFRVLTTKGINIKEKAEENKGKRPASTLSMKESPYTANVGFDTQKPYNNQRKMSSTAHLVNVNKKYKNSSASVQLKK